MQNIQSNEQRNPIDAIHAKARESEVFKELSKYISHKVPARRGQHCFFLFFIKKAKYKKTNIYINIFIHTHI